MILGPLCLAVLAQDTQNTQGTHAGALRALVAAAREEFPARRRTMLRALRKEHALKAAEWESLLAKMPMPPSPLADVETGRILDRRAKLWTGETTGVLDTEIALYLPSGFDPDKRAPLLVTCHGSGGNARGDLSQWVATAERLGMILIGATDQGDNTGYRASEAERLTQLSLLRWAKLRLPVDGGRVFLAGTSRGGHLAWDVATRYPDLWAGVVPMIGGPLINTTGGQNNLRLVRNLLDVPIRDLQGEKDDPGLLFNLRYAFGQLKDARDAKLLTFPDLGHSYRLSAVDWNEFFGKRTRDPLPARIRFWCVNPDHGRRSWLRILRLDRKVQEAYRLQVRASVWNRLDMDGRKRHVQKDAEKKTASIEVRMQGPAGERVVVVESTKGVRAIRLLLPRKLLPAGKGAKLSLRHKVRTRSLAPRASVERMLRDWCDRLDPATVPVATVDVTL